MHPLLFYNGGDSSLVAKLCLTLLRPHGLQPTRPLCTWDSPGKNTGVGHHFLLQKIFLTQRWNPDLLGLLHLLHWQADSLLLRHQGGPLFYNTLRKPHVFLVFFSPIQKNKPHKNLHLYGNPPPISLLSPFLQVITEHWPWVSYVIHQSPTGYLFYIW